MKVIKFIGAILVVLLLGGMVLQVLGYIDSPLFNWLTELHLFNK